MKYSVFEVCCAIGMGFSPLAGILAFVITYQSYENQGFSKQQTRRQALGQGAVALAFFLILSVIMGAACQKILAGS